MKRCKFLKIMPLAVAFMVFYSCSKDGVNNNTDWIDPVFARLLEQRGYIPDASAVTKEQVSKLTYVDVSGIDYSNRGPLKS